LVKQVDDNLSPSKKQTTTQKTMTMSDSNFKKVSWNIHPTVLRFLMATTVSQGKKKTTLRPHVAQVNHNGNYHKLPYSSYKPVILEKD
jgi:hypothetical protein